MQRRDVPPREVLVVHAVPHPNPKVRQVGFELDDPYLEQVWSAVLGPSAVLLLRRLPILWRTQEPAVVNVRELGPSLGLSASLGNHSPTWRTIRRLAQFGMADWLPGDQLGVRTQVAPLTPRLLGRVPDWTRQAHDRLLGDHLDRLAVPQPARVPKTAAVADRLDRLQRRLDDLQRPGPTPTRGLDLTR